MKLKLFYNEQIDVLLCLIIFELLNFEDIMDISFIFVVKYFFFCCQLFYEFVVQFLFKKIKIIYNLYDIVIEIKFQYIKI